MLNHDEQHALLEWYDEHQRALPWRQTDDPWHILLSEILLQQTQVSRGLVYWQRMVETFPTIASMADAPVDAVLKAWEGAGYYSRARRLHALSQRVMLPKAEGGFDGRLPSTYDELLSLPGIGPYTAAAVASIAFGRPVACVDGNIRRVMARQTAQPEPTPKAVQTWADASMETERPGDWNQALMELGATVCTPKRWDCVLCPITESCAGIDDPSLFPQPKSRRITSVSYTTLVEFSLDGNPVLHQRPKDGIYAGLWGFVLDENNIKNYPNSVYCGVIRHQLSHRDIQVEVFLSKGFVEKKGPNTEIVTLSVLDRKILELIYERNEEVQLLSSA